MPPKRKPTRPGRNFLFDGIEGGAKADPDGDALIQGSGVRGVASASSEKKKIFLNFLSQTLREVSGHRGAGNPGGPDWQSALSH